MRKRVLLSLLSLGLTVLLVGGTTWAWFVDRTSSSQQNTFASGTLDISAGHSAWTGTIGNMAPGQTAGTLLTVTNSGSLALKYRMYGTVSGDPGLAAALHLTIQDGATSLYSGPLGQFNLASAIGQALSPGGVQQLTVQVQLAPDATSAAAGKSLDVTFQIEATQPSAGWGH